MRSKHLAAIISLFIIFIFSEQSFAWNQPPVANLEVKPTICIVGDVIDFNGVGSYDSDGYIVDYAWKFGDGGDYISTGLTKTTTHQYGAPNTYTAWLRVEDDDGSHGYDSCTIYVYQKSTTPIYVDKNVNTSDPCYTGEGDSWTNAYQELRDAIDDSDAGALIYVAEGTYLPGTEQDDSFELKYFMEIQGGFPTGGGERDPIAYPTILSGDIGDEGVKSDNCHRVVQGSHGIILDGLTIKAGNTDEVYVEGGGLYCNGDAEIINCIFEDNGGTYYYGGAVCNFGDENTQKFTNCVFSGNQAFIGGAVSNAVAYDNKANTQEFVNCVFTGNTADDGGAVISHLQDTTFTNCTFYGNEASDDAGGVYSDESTLEVTNCIFWGNTADDDVDAQIYVDSGNVTVNYSCIQDGWSGTGNIDDDPKFADSSEPDGEDGRFLTEDDGLQLTIDSSCIDAADGDAALGTDICGHHRLDVNFIPNTGTGNPDYVDIGAYEYNKSPGYITSFEEYQGYTGSIDGNDGWEIESGSAILWKSTEYYDYNHPIIDKFPYQCVRIYKNSIISHYSDLCTKSTIRINCIPSSASFINIMNGSSVVASIKFGEDDDPNIYVWDNESYEPASTAPHNYQEIAEICRDFVTADPLGNMSDPNYSYENTWMEFVIQFDWQDYTYDVSWAHMDEPNGAVIYSGADFNDSNCFYTNVEFETGDPSYDYFWLNRMSLSDTNSTGGDIGPDPDDDIWLTLPEADILNPLKGHTALAGKMWYDKLGEYVIQCCPVDLDADDANNWITVCSGKTVGECPVLLGYWNAEAYYNGSYFLKIQVYDDLRRFQSEEIITVELTFNGSIENCNVRYPITGRLKPRSFHYEECPDFTINWPGTFPFEFKRTYNHGLRSYLYPLFFGWTHNHNIHLIEDCSFDWIEDANGNPERDDNGLGIGRLWLCQPVGGTPFIGHVDDVNPQNVIYEPLDNENHHIIRTVNSVDTNNPDKPVFDVTYVYYMPDGMKMTFEKEFTGDHNIPADEGFVGWMLTAGIDSQEDRFGNALIYDWQDDEIHLDEISNSQTDAKLVFTYELDPYGPFSSLHLCSCVTLDNGDPLTTDGSVTFEVTFEDDVSWIETTVDYGDVDHHVIYYYDYNEPQEKFILGAIEPDPWVIGYEQPFDIYTFLEYDDDGTLTRKSEGWEGQNPFHYHHFVYNYDYDDEGNLITTTTHEAEDRFIDFFDKVSLREEVIVTSPEGALLSNSIKPFTILLEDDEEFDPYDYGTWRDLYDKWGQMQASIGGGGVVDANYYYEDSNFPVHPTTIIEYFDDDGDGEYDRPSRKTTMKYDNRGNVAGQKVYVDDVNYVYTEYDYHQDYDFPVRQTTWKGYCQDDGNDIVTSGAKNEKLWLYGYADGTPIEGGNKGDYLVQESELLDDMGTSELNDDKWADTFYEYYSGADYGGQIKRKDDPEGNITYYEYDVNGFLSKEWQGAVLAGGSPVGFPQKRYYYDRMGRKILEADYLGKVQMNVCDSWGRVTQARQYKDENPMSRNDFEPDTYDADIADDNEESDWWESRTVYSMFGPYNTPARTTLSTGGVIDLYHFRGKYPVWECIYDSDWNSDGRVIYTLACNNRGKIVREQWYVENSDPNGLDIYSFYDSMYDQLMHRYSYFPYSDASDPYDYIKHEEFDYDASGNKTYEAVYKVTRIAEDSYESEMEKWNSFEYDILNRLTKKIIYYNDEDANQIIEYGYDALGNRIYVIDPNGDVIFTDYDNANRKICEYFATPAVPNREELDIEDTKAYAVVKREVNYYKNNKIKDVNSYDYDSSLLARTEYSYDSRGRIKEVQQLIEDIDQNGRMDPTDVNATTLYDYNDVGTLERVPEDPCTYHIVITDANNKPTGIKLSYHGKPEKITYPSGVYEEYEYYSRPLQFELDGSYADPYIYFNGLLEEKTVWEGINEKHITYEYDNFGKVKKIKYPSYYGDIEYDYTTRILGRYGKVKRITDRRYKTDNPGGSERNYTLTFDHWYLSGKVKSYTDYWGYTANYDYSCAYDQPTDINVTNPADELIYDVDYVYDLAGRLIDVYEPLLDGDNDLIAHFDYDENGNRDMLTYSLNGKEVLDESVSIDYNYNLDNLLTGYNTTSTGVTGPTFTLSDVNVDGLGRLVSAGETITEVDNVSTISYLLNNFTNPDDYPYDMRSQLIKARIERTTAPASIWQAEYNYRKDGNIDTRETSDTSETTFDYDFQAEDDGDIMTGATGGENFTLEWDLNGNMTKTDMNSGDDTTLVYNWDNKLRSGTKGADPIHLKYDPMGNRVWKDSSVTGLRKYVVDIGGNLPTILLELDGSGDIMKTYIYANGQILAQHDGDHEGNRYFYLHDRLGSVRQIINTSGTVEKRYTYKPFGEVLQEEGSFDNPFMFTGQYYDKEISEYYLRARQYDPYISRFTSRDPVRGEQEEPLTLHKYLYCLNDPMNRFDPYGKWAVYVTGTIMGSFGASGVFQYGQAWDDEGNVDDILIFGGGGGSPALSFGVSVGWAPFADTIYDLEGPGGTTGGSYGPIGVEAFFGDKFGMGIEFTISLPLLMPYIPAELHGHVTSTSIGAVSKAISQYIFEEGIYNAETWGEATGMLNLGAILGR